MTVKERDYSKWETIDLISILNKRKDANREKKIKP